MNKIDVISAIKREELEEKNYFKTLIEEAYAKQLLTDEDMADIQLQILRLLDETIYKYNGIDSSSVRKEIMEEIMTSNYYTMSIYLKTFRKPDDAVKTIREDGIKKIYEEGKKKIKRMLDVTRILYLKVKQNKININNDTYHDTIEGIEAFFIKYDPDFKAQDMIITADYPTYNSLVGKLEGIEFIREYLNSIYLENCFCSNFSTQKINGLLYSYSHDCEKLIINIFEIVLLEVFGNKLAKREIQELTILHSELNEIYSLFEDRSEVEIEEKLRSVYGEIENELLLTDNKELQKYVAKNINIIIEQIKVSLKQKNLDKMFITQKYIHI